jgi:hypothetical protein
LIEMERMMSSCSFTKYALSNSHFEKFLIVVSINSVNLVCWLMIVWFGLDILCDIH